MVEKTIGCSHNAIGFGTKDGIDEEYYSRFRRGPLFGDYTCFKCNKGFSRFSIAIHMQKQHAITPEMVKKRKEYVECPNHAALWVIKPVSPDSKISSFDWLDKDWLDK